MLKFLKNKKGEAIIYGVVIIPFIVGITFFVIFRDMKSSILYKNIQTTADNIALFNSKKYGFVKYDKEGLPMCDFNLSYLLQDPSLANVSTYENYKKEIDIDMSGINELNPETSNNPYSELSTFLSEIYLSLLKIDGVNNKWEVKVIIRTNKYDNTYIEPNKSEHSKYILIDVKCVLPNSHAETIDSYTAWYNENPKTWQNMQNNNNYTIKEVEVYASCV